MTDLTALFDESTALGMKLDRIADEADTLIDDVTALAAELAEIALSRDTRDLLNTIVGRVKDLSKDADKARGDSDDITIGLDDAQLEQRATSDIADLVLDVERGLRDHDELLEAARASTGTYVL